jgi:hypothetical protein
MPPRTTAPKRRSTRSLSRPGAPQLAGYSGTPLAKKLGLKAGQVVCVIGAPQDYPAILGPGLTGIHVVAAPGTATDIAHVFASRRGELTRTLARLRQRLRADAAVWVSWPKKSAQVPTDITEDVVRAVALPMGFVDIKVCAVTEIWSGLKLVVRQELR